MESNLNYDIKKAIDFLKKGDDFCIVCHYDCDGLCSGAIMAQVLKNMGKEFTIHVVKRLDEEIVKKVERVGEKFIFTDLGSGYISKIEHLDCLVLDHHPPEKKGDLIHINPAFYGMDGTTEISGAGVCYMIARSLGMKKESKKAIIGAVGDNQDSSSKLIGYNRKTILRDGIKEGLVLAEKDIRLFGRHSRPLVQFLSYAMNPIFPGLTGNDSACKEFLMNLGIDLKDNSGWRRYYQLSLKEKKKLISALYMYGKKRGIKEDALKKLVGENYEFLDEEEGTELRDAREFSSLLNACGRNGKGYVGIGVLMGDRERMYKRARTLLERHRKRLRDGIMWAEENGIDMGPFILLDGRGKIGDEIIGTIAGMVFPIFGYSKPIIGLAIDERGMVKVSARGTFDFPFHLGEIMKKLGNKYGTAGGGHKVAAGASIYKENVNAFLEDLKRMLNLNNI